MMHLFPEVQSCNPLEIFLQIKSCKYRLSNDILKINGSRERDFPRFQLSVWFAHCWNLLFWRLSKVSNPVIKSISYFIESSAKWVLCNIRYPPATHLKLKSRKIPFAYNLSISYPIVFFFSNCTEHGNDTAMLCANYQTNWTIEMEVMDKRDFARFEFKMSFGRIS